MDIADSFDDLPDHLCVELEFMHMLCFREKRSRRGEDLELDPGVRAARRNFWTASCAFCYASRRLAVGLFRTILTAIYLKQHDAFCWRTASNSKAGGLTSENLRS